LEFKRLKEEANRVIGSVVNDARRLDDFKQEKVVKQRIG